MAAGAESRVRVASLADLAPGSTLLVEVDLPERGIGEHMTGILRAVASGDFELVPTPREEG